VFLALMVVFFNIRCGVAMIVILASAGLADPLALLFKVSVEGVENILPR